MNIGDILAVHHNTFIGRKIRKIIKGNYNHVGIFVTNRKIVEACFNGVIISDISKFEKGKCRGKLDFDIFGVHGLSNNKKLQIVKFSLNQIGKKYDFPQFLSQLFFYIFNINRKKCEPIEYSNKFICSELVAEAFDYANISLTDKVDVDNINPMDIINSKIVFKKT